MSDDSSRREGVLPVRLASRELGGVGNPRLVILHGLLGSSRNWIVAGRELARHFHVTALDLRNHGDSPHASANGMDEMVGDVLAWLAEQNLASVRLMGHSLGGKVAMRLACRHASRVEHLFVLDIAPRSYSPSNPMIDAMIDLDLDALELRRDADKALSEMISDPPTRAFVLTNLAQDADGRFRWRCGLTGLAAYMREMRSAPLTADDVFLGPTLFVVGERSTYFVDRDAEHVEEHFPNARIETLRGAGHNVHVDAREVFVRTVTDFDRSLRS